MRLPPGLCLVGVWLALTSLLHAASIEATLRLEGAAEKLTVQSAPTGRRPNGHRRAVLHATVDEPLTGHWTCRGKDGGPATDVLVHFFVVREDQLNQSRVPRLLPDRVVIESALTMDFQAHNTAKANLSFKVHQPGYYLVRVEAQGPDASELTEDAAALDLEVK
ncbi:MAG: hypothetical protein KGS61_07700 [Verrucomicrobia bacterium]|nr:hypothetical protein [Verrucomicrobiota bacterium]